MKIIYDTSWHSKGGIGKYSEEIGKKLTGIEFFSYKGNPASPLSALKITCKMIFEKESFFILPGYIPPLFIKNRFFFTIHDLNHLDIPDNSSFMKRLFYKYVIKKGCHNASKVLTVSEFSKDRIVKWSGVDPDKVIVVGNGVDSSFKPSEEKNNNTESGYFLCVSNRKTHKNEKRVIEAFSSANIDKNITLIMTGKVSIELEELISNKKLKERVIFTGYLTERELINLYQKTIALLFPSLYEGFGIPVLEAMACGVPVITSKTTALSEIAGDAALLVDPENTNEIMGAIERIISDSALQQDMIKKGLNRCREFSWEKTTDKIAAQLKLQI
ncbi:glycosyltransferase family 4 protein [Serratia fonticola]|uniref:glycosyltransferase family 4 protein n=1 Tax=Serratia fonticola TaxID=47917 RepID=UPI00217AAF5A|nr:glycosyltransferase family 1 protein [Serratia fonticola]CAI1665059.1 Glycogen synthase [Serratia fonticola]